MELTEEQRANGCMMSSGPNENLREGWALLSREGGAMWHGTPHFWRRIENGERYISLCGLFGNVQVAHFPAGTAQKLIFDPGDFIAVRCSKCGLKRSKEVAGRR